MQPWIAAHKLDDILTLATDREFPSASGAGEYDNDAACYVVGGEAVISGDVLCEQPVELVAGQKITLGTLRDEWRPAFFSGRTTTINLGDGEDITATCAVTPEGVVWVRPSQDAQARVYDFGLDLRYPLAGAVL